MGLNLKLKIAIAASGKSQRQLAATSHIPEARISSIVRGWTSPRDTERDAIAAALGKPVADLFDEQDHEPALRQVATPSSAA